MPGRLPKISWSAKRSERFLLSSRKALQTVVSQKWWKFEGGVISG